MDLDLGTLGTVERLELALTNTLSKIKQKMDGVPSVIWSGNGYHIYQPVEAFILEEQQIFNGLDQPSRRLVQYAERYLTSGKMGRMSQPYHVAQELYASCTREPKLQIKSS